MDQLLTNLQEQLAVINQVIQITRDERDAILNKDTSLLQTCRQKKEQLLAALSRLEQKRTIITNGKTLREIAAEPEAPAEELLTIRHTLKVALRELQSENETNRLFLQHELAYLDQIRKAFTPESQPIQYTKSGMLSPQLQGAGPVVSMRA